MNDASTHDAAGTRALVTAITSNIAQVMSGQAASIRNILAAFLAGGHVLLEDNPGTGKTTMAKALARTIGADYRRVQFTPDLLPSDILGVSVLTRATSRSSSMPGRYSPRSCSPTRSTARARARNRRCSRRWPSAR